MDLNSRTTKLNSKCNCEFGILQHMGPGETSNTGCVIRCMDNGVLVGKRGLEWECGWVTILVVTRMIGATISTLPKLYIN